MFAKRPLHPMFIYRLYFSSREQVRSYRFGVGSTQLTEDEPTSLLKIGSSLSESLNSSNPSTSRSR